MQDSSALRRRRVLLNAMVSVGSLALTCGSTIAAGFTTWTNASGDNQCRNPANGSSGVPVNQSFPTIPASGVSTIDLGGTTRTAISVTASAGSSPSTDRLPNHLHRRRGWA